MCGSGMKKHKVTLILIICTVIPVSLYLKQITHKGNNINLSNQTELPYRTKEGREIDMKSQTKMRQHLKSTNLKEAQILRNVENEKTDESNTNTFLIQDGNVRDCISKFIVRKARSVETKPFSPKYEKTTVPNEASNDRQHFFEHIYKNHVWKGVHGPVNPKLADVQGSGPGSTLAKAQEAMAALHTIINELKISLGKDTINMLDIPCGDFVWMSRFLETRADVKYTGMDIVPHLIENHQKAYKKQPTISFVLQDIVEVPLKEKYDLIFCRMMLQHLQTSDLMKVLQNFHKSGSYYLLTTTHPGSNQTIPLRLRHGRFRFVNMEVPPVSLKPPICMSRDGPPDRAGDHYLGLWELPLKQQVSCQMKEILPPHSKIHFTICD